MKLTNYHSYERSIIEQKLASLPLGEKHLAGIIESFMYSQVEIKNQDGILLESYQTKFGEKHGKYYKWHVPFEPGQTPFLFVECNYKDGKRHGEYKEYFASNQLRWYTSFQDGIEHGDVLHYHSNGIKYHEYSCVNGVKEGKFLSWSSNGLLALVSHYKHNLLHGSLDQWSFEGKHKKTWLYQHGVVKKKLFTDLTV